MPMSPDSRDGADTVLPSMRSFWFEFAIPFDAACPAGVREGVGVTAIDRRDALDLVAQGLFGGCALPPLRLEIEDVAFHRLDPWLVLPNLGDPGPRGVWFPARRLVLQRT